MGRRSPIKSALILGAIPALLLPALLLMVPGCNVIAPVAYAIHGPEKVLPVLTLDPEKSTVIFIDDPSSKVAQRRLRYAMADLATRQLLEKRLLTDAIDSRTILNAATKERYGERMSITELGKSVGADIVIYAVVTSFTVARMENTFIPAASLRVKVIDVATGERVWPSSEAGHLVDIRIKQRADLSGSDGGLIAIEQQLADRAGLGLAQLFYKHEVPDSVLNGR